MDEKGKYTGYKYGEMEQKGDLSIVCESANEYVAEPGGSFAKTFAKRTLINLEFIERAVEERRKKGMKDEDIHDVFEVTQLINSFLGLLVIPKEKYYRSVDGNKGFKSEEARRLFDEIIKEKRFQSSYTYTNYKTGVTEKEKLNPKTLAKHFRNAVAHGHLEILPQDMEGDGIITGVRFKDSNFKPEKKTGGQETFSLELTIEEIKILTTALCEMFLSNA